MATATSASGRYGNVPIEQRIFGSAPRRLGSAWRDAIAAAAVNQKSRVLSRCLDGGAMGVESGRGASRWTGVEVRRSGGRARVEVVICRSGVLRYGRANRSRRAAAVRIGVPTSAGWELRAELRSRIAARFEERVVEQHQNGCGGERARVNGAAAKVSMQTMRPLPQSGQSRRDLPVSARYRSR